MARFLLAWELGEGLGHLNRLLPVAQRLDDAGHELLWAVKDVISGRMRLQPAGMSCLQAPVRAPSGVEEMPLSLADILTNLGFADRAALEAILKAWIDLLQTVAPAAVLADYAPTALLAARVLDLPTASFGNGFEIPPEGAPLPSLQPWTKVPQGRLVRLERPILETINAVLAGHGKAPLSALSDLFRGRETLLCCFPEFDHYGARATAEYLGPVLTSAPQAAAVSEIAGRRRSFFYLSGRHPFTRPMLEYLARGGEPAAGYVRDMDEAERKSLSSLSLRISPSPLDMQEVLASSRLVICHAGVGTIQASILSGVPVVMLPSSAEQAVMAYRVGHAGLGMPVPSKKHMAAIAQIMQRTRQADVYERVAAVAARYADFDPESQTDVLTRRCLSLLPG